jgi:hypothetical protein
MFRNHGSLKILKDRLLSNCSLKLPFLLSCAGDKTSPLATFIPEKTLCRRQPGSETPYGYPTTQIIIRDLYLKVADTEIPPWQNLPRSTSTDFTGSLIFDTAS